MSPWLLVFIVCSVNGRIEHVLIYKRGHFYGFLDNEVFTSVDKFVAELSRRGLSIDEAGTPVALTNRLFPDK